MKHRHAGGDIAVIAVGKPKNPLFWRSAYRHISSTSAFSPFGLEVFKLPSGIEF